MESPKDYFDFKLQMIPKTYELYIKRLDVFEDWFHKTKYGCITLIVILLGFKYIYAKTETSLNFIGIAVTLGLWIFEATLRTTAFRIIAKMDLLTEILNNNKLMENAFKTRKLEALRFLDFDLRRKILKEIIESAFPEMKDELKLNLYKQKTKITTIWSSFKLKNVLVFYCCLILFQIIACICF